MPISRLEKSTNAPLRDIASITSYCDEHKIPYSTDFIEKIAPSSDLKADFYKNYNLSPLAPNALKQRGTSAVLVFESRAKLQFTDGTEAWSHHGDVSAAISKVVGSSLATGVDSLYIHTPLDPDQRKSQDPDRFNSVKTLIENQGVPVIHTSIGWNDGSLDFDAGNEDKANHLWRVTAFLVDSAGNDGQLGYKDSPPPPVQKHNALTHFAPLVVHVGAASMDENGVWKIDGYSSANSPTFLAPVASNAKIHWNEPNEGHQPANIMGTSAAAPYASGALAALNSVYGSYLTREQILYAVLATCTPINQVTAFGNKTPANKTIFYETNKAGLLYNPEYAGFGLIHIHKADKLLAQMVALTQKNPESITIPTEERVTMLNCETHQQVEKDGSYSYKIKMPVGIALKTTVEADFGEEKNGSIKITSPAGTTLPMVMSKLDASIPLQIDSLCEVFASNDLNDSQKENLCKSINFLLEINLTTEDFANNKELLKKSILNKYNKQESGHVKTMLEKCKNIDSSAIMAAYEKHTKHFGMSTCHGFAGENLEGEWTINSTTPIKRLRLNQHHFLEKDIVKDLNINQLLNAPAPNLQNAEPLEVIKDEKTHRVQITRTIPQSAELTELGIGDAHAQPLLDDTKMIVEQLKALPSGFEKRNRPEIISPVTLDKDNEADKLEIEANKLLRSIAGQARIRDDLRHQAIEKYLAAAEEYEKIGKPAQQITSLINAAVTYLNCKNAAQDEGLNVEKSVPIYQKALEISKREKSHFQSYSIVSNLYTALCRCCAQGKASEYAGLLEDVRKQTAYYSQMMQGGADDKAYRIEEGEFGFSNHDKIGTDNISQCITMVVQDTHTLKTGLVHLNNSNDVRTLDSFFAGFGDDRLKIRIIGARFDDADRPNSRNLENLANVMKYLSHKNVDIISADICGGENGPSAVVVNPRTFELEEKVPTKYSENCAASNVALLYGVKGRPLIKQFDLTEGKDIAPVHMNSAMLQGFRDFYLDKPEWEIEKELSFHGITDRPLIVSHILGLQESYKKEWQNLSGALETAITENKIDEASAKRAREALLQQTIFVGKNATKANQPIYDWIKSKLFKDGSLQHSALEDQPTAGLDLYAPAKSSNTSFVDAFVKKPDWVNGV